MTPTRPADATEVTRLVNVMLDALEREIQVASANELVSAAMTLVLITMTAVTTCGGSLEPFRPGLERMYALLPQQTRS